MVLLVLKCGTVIVEGFELKDFFDQHYQHVYHVFYDMFSHVEFERKNKGD